MRRQSLQEDFMHLDSFLKDSQVFTKKKKNTKYMDIFGEVDNILHSLLIEI